MKEAIHKIDGVVVVRDGGGIKEEQVTVVRRSIPSRGALWAARLSHLISALGVNITWYLVCLNPGSFLLESLLTYPSSLANIKTWRSLRHVGSRFSCPDDRRPPRVRRFRGTVT